ncbi:serine hydroxymethyltransferase [Parvibaculum sp.]|uniref:DUF6898 family protein n=1 Tax=Parvibaculum sp. TaxID=2024848 RepID=UPI0035227EBB
MPPDRGTGSPPGSRGDGGGERREVIFEYTPIGASVKVTAVDVATGLEVSVVGPSIAPQTELERVAMRKLRYMLEKRGDIKKDDGKGDPEPPSGGGIVV